MYNHIAGFYDKSIDTDNYFNNLADFAQQIIEKSDSYRIYADKQEQPIVLDCACGTGRLTKILYERGFDMIGLDVSDNMLDTAREVCAGLPVLFICQDMCEMDLFGSIAAITCMTDSVNHITDMKSLENFFSKAHNFLDPGGVLIFDVLTDKHFEDMEADKCFFEDYDWGSCFWTGSYDSQKRICKYNISYFEYTGMKNGNETYIRTDDYITEKIWSLRTLNGLLNKTGFSQVMMYDNTKFEPVNNNSHRIYFVAVKS